MMGQFLTLNDNLRKSLANVKVLAAASPLALAPTESQLRLRRRFSVLPFVPPSNEFPNQSIEPVLHLEACARRGL